MIETSQRGPSPHQLRNFFVLALVVGMLGVVAGSLLPLPPLLSALLTLGVPIAAMGGYVFSGWMLGHMRQTREAFADSVYYLGFLFTLVALAVSLFALDDVDLSGIVDRFGVALATTIIGLVTRVILVSFYATTDEELEGAGDALRRATQTLTDRVDHLATDVVTHVSSFDAAMSQAVAASGAAMQVSIQESARALGEVVESLRQSIAKGAQQLDAAVTSVDENIRDRVGGGADELARTLAASGADVRRAAERLAEDLGSTKLPAATFGDELAEPLRMLKSHMVGFSLELAAALETQKELGQDTQNFRQAVHHMVREVAGVSSAFTALAGESGGISALRSQTEAVTRALGDLQASYDAHRASVQQHSVAVGGFSQATSQNLELARSHKEQVGRHLADATSAVGKVHDELIRAAKLVVSELGTGS